MKYTLVIEDHTYQVEIGNLHTNPIITWVNGSMIEVYTEPKTDRAISSGEARPAPPVSPKPPPTSSAQVSDSDLDHLTIRSPIPGTIISIAVKPGDEVEAGQELCVLEAMKMKNMIRAPRTGTIATVQVSAGQSVQHRDLLMEYAE